MQPQHLTYCTNIHSGESLAEVERALLQYSAEVKARVSPEASFNVGLRLSGRAAKELAVPARLDRFAAMLQEQGLYVTTLNGFPYGAFHATRVKEQVYRPDWQEAERVAYTLDLVRILKRLLPAGVAGSISTVPGAFKPRVLSDGVPTMVQHLLSVVAVLTQLEREEGKLITLALEPEPSCFLETTAEAISFFKQEVWAEHSLQQLSKLTGLSLSAAEAALRRHLGVCLDICHAAVEFESPLEAWRSLQSNAVAVPKIQVSAGLRLDAPDSVALAELRRFVEPVYLHQVVVRQQLQLLRYVDLDLALATAPSGPGTEWRVHFHVPLFETNFGAFSSTQEDAAILLRYLGQQHGEPQLEVETYTWDVLPEALRRRPLVDAIAAEISWAREQWARGHAGIAAVNS